MLQRRPRYPKRYYGYSAIPRTQDTFAKYGPHWGAATPAQRQARLADRYSGAGMYTGSGMFNPFTTKLGRRFRHRLSGIASQEVGKVADAFIPGSRRTVAKAAHAGLKYAGIGRYKRRRGRGMYTGSGSYKQAVSNDLIEGGHASEGIMRFDAQNDEDAITISHSEYVMDVYAPPDGESKTDIKLPLNVGQTSVFPMLSQIAANFEEYEIKQMSFTYKPTLSDWQTTQGQVGQVLMATNYNPNAAKWTTKQQMLAQTGSTSARVIDSTFHGIECDTSKMHNDGHYMVRTGPPRLDTNLTDYDHGWTQLSIVDTPPGSAATGGAANKTLGELHVSYTIRLSKPRIWAGLANNLPTSYAQASSEGQGWGLANELNVTANDFNFGYVSNKVYDPADPNSPTTKKVGIYCPTAQNADSMYTARQGSLDVKYDVHNAVQHGGHGVLRVLFPASFQGEVELDIAAVCHDKFEAQVNGATLTTYSPKFIFTTTGNVDDVKDMKMQVSDGVSGPRISPFPSMGFSDLTAGTTSVGDSQWSIAPQSSSTWGPISDVSNPPDTDTVAIAAKIRFRLQAASNATDNAVLINIAAVNGFTNLSTLDVRDLQIKCRAINTRLNYSDDGSNDKVILIDQSKQIVTY